MPRASAWSGFGRALLAWALSALGAGAWAEEPRPADQKVPPERAPVPKREEEDTPPPPPPPPNPIVQKLEAELKAKNPLCPRCVEVNTTRGAITWVRLKCEHIKDLSPLRGLPLRVLICPSAQVTDLSPLAGMPLEDLRIHGLPVRDLAPLRGLPLRKLDCSRTQASDLAPLAGMPLEELRIAGTPIRDLSPLKGLRLRTLDCSDTQVADLSPLKGMPLEALGINGLPIRDLDALRGLPLRSLGCSKTQVTDLSPLKGMPLEKLWIAGLAIPDLRPLLDLPLQRLTLSPQKDADLAVLRSHKSLEWVGFGEGAALTLRPIRGYFLSQDVQRGARRLAATLAGHKGAVDSVAISPNGLSLASAGSDGTVRVWDGATGECLHVLRDARRLPPIRIAFFPDDGLLFCRGADGARKIWDLGKDPPGEWGWGDGLDLPPEMDAAARAKLLKELGEHAKGVTAVAASRGNRRIVMGSADGAVRVWAIGPPDTLEEHWLDEPARRRLAAAMQKKVSFDFVETPLPDVVNFLSSLVDITIVLDPRAVTNDTPNVTLRVSEMLLQEALRRICGLVNMTHVTHQSALLVTSAERAKSLRAEAEELRLWQWPEGDEAAAKLPLLLRSVTFDFVETPHQDVFNFLHSLVDLPIFPDPQALKEDVPNVTLRVNEMRLHCALRWICQTLGRDFVWHDGALWVTTAQRARDLWRLEQEMAAFQEPASAELAKKMELPIRLDFAEVPLAEALQRLSKEAGLYIELELEASEAKKKTVTLRVQGMAAGRALRWLCRSVGLTHVWRGPEIVVTTPGHARQSIGTEADNPVARRLHAALKACNPRYQRNAAFSFRGAELEGLDLNGDRVSDLSPLKGLRLRSLECRDSGIRDLAPLAGMPLEELDCSDNKITDLSPLRGMPLKRLNCARNQVRDLSPLAGLPLERLDCGSNPIADLAPLRTVPLRRLELWKTAVTDLSPVKGTKLEELGLGRLAISDLSPLLGLPLKRLAFPTERPGADLTPFESHKTLEGVGFDCPLDGAAAPLAILRLSREVASGTWRLAASLPAHQGSVDALFVTPDGLRVISCGRDGAVRVWDATTGECIHTRKGLRAPIKLVLSWDGSFLYTREEGGAVKLWDAATGDYLKTYPAGSKDDVFAAKAPDTEKLLKALGNQAEGATAVAASRDGHRIATGAADGAVRLWAIGPPSPIEERRFDEPLRKRLAAALEKKITLDFAGAELDKVVGGLRNLAGLNIALDPQAFGNEDPRFTVRLNDRPAADALKKVCDAAGLVQLECDGVMLLTSSGRVAAVRGPLEATCAQQWPSGDELAPWLRRMSHGVTFDFVETPLLDVLNYMACEEVSGGFTLLLDPQAPTSELPNVTATFEGMRLASALRLVCRLMGLVYLWLDGGILVTTPERVREILRQQEAQTPLQRPPTAELAKQMAKPVSFDFVQVPLADVVAQLGKECGVPMVLDTKEGKREVTVWGNQMPLERALRWVCRASGMAYTWRDGGIVLAPNGEKGRPK